jgi:TRAP-type mannitol/chloroaromatic compound transport system substrate-binding protein
MTKSISLNALWESATSTELVFSSDKLSHLPEAAKRYLKHALAFAKRLPAQKPLRRGWKMRKYPVAWFYIWLFIPLETLKKLQELRVRSIVR